MLSQLCFYKRVNLNSAEITVNNLKKYFMQGAIQLEVLKGISYCFKQGHTYAITGVSGTGKSTFIHLLAGLDTPSAGSVYFNNQNLASLSVDERRLFLNKSVGLVFQLPYLIRELSVLENIMLKGLIAEEDIATCERKAYELLAKIDLKDKAQDRPTTLSGGQQQRVAVLRAIFNKPAFLLADEPTGNLDEQTGKIVVDLLLECNTDWGMGIIVSSHDAYVAQNMSTVFQLKDGFFIEKSNK